MKRLIFCILFVQVMILAQAQKSTSKKVVKNSDKNNPLITSSNKTANGFVINGTAILPDGTVLKLLNGSTGAEDQSVIVKNNKFSFKGRVESPDFKLIGVNGQPPFITLFLDNSNVTITANKDALETAEVKGSPSNNDFVAFNTATAKYQDLFAGKGRYDVNYINDAGNTIEKFVNTHKSSFISPFAIYRHSEVTGDFVKQEELYKLLSPNVQASPIGKYIADQIKANADAGYGKPLADFSQADTSGKMVSLSSFKGKYVLVDFWASWCGPCRGENPNVVRTYELYKNKNFTVLGISLDRDKAKWMEAIAADGLNWTHLSDLQFWNNAVAKQFGINSIPQNFLLDPQGNLIGKNLRGSALEYKLMRVIK